MRNAVLQVWNTVPLLAFRLS